MYSTPFDRLNSDIYAPVVTKLSNQQWDNYGIYTLVCIDTSKTVVTTTYNYKQVNGKYIVKSGNFVKDLPEIYADTLLLDRQKMAKFFAYQSASVRQIPVNFRQYVEDYSDLGVFSSSNKKYGEITVLL
jgi:hypothetical protein